MYRYPWPASAIGQTEMRLLHQAREQSPERTTITQLIADAVRRAYASRCEMPREVHAEPMEVAA